MNRVLKSTLSSQSCSSSSGALRGRVHLEISITISCIVIITLFCNIIIILLCEQGAKEHFHRRFQWKNDCISAASTYQRIRGQRRCTLNFGAGVSLCGRILLRPKTGTLPLRPLLRTLLVHRYILQNSIIITIHDIVILIPRFTLPLRALFRTLLVHRYNILLMRYYYIFFIHDH